VGKGTHINYGRWTGELKHIHNI